MARHTSAWVMREQSGINSLELIKDHTLRRLGEHDVLVKLLAASLNYRETAIARGEPALSFFRPGIVPGSNGVGIVEAVGPHVRTFKPGDREICEAREAYEYLQQQRHFSKAFIQLQGEK